MGLTSIAAVGTVLVLLGVVARQRMQIARLAARLTDVVRNDDVTGLLNRAAFEELLEAEIDRSRRTDRPVSVVVGDLDGLGHSGGAGGSGAEALRLITRDMQKWKRKIDVGARIGDHQFAVIVRETDERGAFLVAERLRRAAHRTFAEHPRKLTICFGVASYPSHGDDRELLLTAAEQAVRAAKELGRDRSVIYSEQVGRMLASSRGPNDAELQLATVLGLAEALDMRATGTPGHSREVGRYSELIARELGLPDDRTDRVRVAGVLHDVGRIGVSDLILTKPGPLDEEEWSEMRRHPEIAARLLAHDDLGELRDWVLMHHERPDGKGYPKGLCNEQIPLEAKIVAVADAYEALVSNRPWRPAFDAATACAELEAAAGTRFDAEVVGALVRALPRSIAASELPSEAPRATLGGSTAGTPA
jgi:diguanylate cyclase (GGDEF)-like protein